MVDHMVDHPYGKGIFEYIRHTTRVSVNSGTPAFPLIYQQKVCISRSCRLLIIEVKDLNNRSKTLRVLDRLFM